MTGAPTPEAPTPEPAVAVRGLRKRYGAVVAVDGLDLDVPTGSMFGLIGPNGAGKTTTMLALATLLAPDAGSMRVFGHDPARDPVAVRRLVGWMPDFFGVYSGLTCAEYLDFFAAAYRLPPARRRRQVGDLLELVELAHKRDVDVAALSRGMQQRLGLARTLVHDPALLVLDEPASGLDPRARVEVREVLRELVRQGKTVLVSSHILAELGELCDRIGIIEAGRLLAQGTPEELSVARQGATAVTIRVLGGPEVLDRAVAAASEAGAVSAGVEDGMMRAEVAGGEEAVAGLLGALVTAGFRVASCTEERSSLERLFLSVTEGVTQ